MDPDLAALRSPARRRSRAGLVVGILALVLVGGCLGCTILVGVAGGGNSRENRRRGDVIVAALLQRQEAEGKLPEELAALVPVQLPAVPLPVGRGGAVSGEFRYFPSKDRASFRLVFPDYTGFFLPSDMFWEWSSPGTGWTMKEWSEVDWAEGG